MLSTPLPISAFRSITPLFRSPASIRNYRRLGSFEAATEHISAAQEHAPNLPQDAYGALLRTAIEQVAEAITQRNTAKRASAPGHPA